MSLELSLIHSKDNCWPELEKILEKNGFEKSDIKRAFEFADKMHSGQKRISGDDYIVHPSWVAKVVAQLGVGKEAIMAALLHDCVEDSETCIEEVAKEFGDEVALLVTGMTDVRDMTKTIKVHETNIEVFRRFLFSSVDDVRVLVIRLVDKLHNGLTISVMPEYKQLRYGKRVLGIYSPMAEYVGLHYFKRLLDDIAFRLIKKEDAEKLEKDLRKRSKDEFLALKDINSEIEEMLKLNNINGFEVEGRIKSLYSTYLKIKNKGSERVKDRVGIRILLNSIEECYTVLGLLHAKFRYLPDEFDDYISVPKPNGYRSIQTTINWKDKLTVEVQIRTKMMHEFNEFGPASHIAYKTVNGTGKGYEWVKDLIEWQKDEDKENISKYRINVLSKYIYVFTPKGDTVQLVKGATALDFAYKLHSDIGDHCYGAMVNNKMGKIDDELKTGDIVEIITSKKVGPNKSWLGMAKTAAARERIRKKLNEKKYVL